MSTDGSINSTRDTEYTEDEKEYQNEQSRSGYHRSSLRESSRVTEEKKSCDSAVSVCDTQNSQQLSIQERSQWQREMQLKFLQEQGFIRSANDVRGGAGARSSASVASSTTSKPCRIN